MDWEDYRTWVGNRRMTVEDCHTDLFSIMGLMGEAGELSELLKKEYFHGKELDTEKVLSEAGDVFFYFTSLLLDEGLTLDQVMEHNKKKLENRNDERYRP